MSVVISPDSELGKELVKWEQHHTPYVGHGQTPGNPYRYRPFPKMVYRAVKKDNGKVVCMEGEPSVIGFLTDAEYLRAVALANAITAQCNKVVNSEDEWHIAKGQGWCESPTAAIAQFEREEQAVATAAAEANFTAQRMSPKAQAERKAREAATDKHVPE